MAGRLQANHGCGCCNRQNKLAHFARPEIPRLVVVKRVGRVLQYFAAKGAERRKTCLTNDPTY
jgi:hypothetical protein